MPCYGGVCNKECPLYEAQHPYFLRCSSCGNRVISLIAKDGKCPKCGGLLEREGIKEDGGEGHVD